MINYVGALRRSGVGRPEIGDREQILGHFAVELAKKRTVREIAKDGLKIYGYVSGSDGKPVLSVIRALRGATLERRYRELRKELDDALRWAITAPLLANASYIGVSTPKAPLSFGAKPDLKRGRPRKNRTR
ncbi:hypothetical protein [Erythrobacter sp. SG61-1L]|uniref:hypothetical protein n=1 Tax=Erythrobacter sp. SG61-1L TaxID=1603897 RepID=UPI000B21A429|nr:hypothetical protein [Erythrobacter sp. SG61-1L]